MADFDLAIVGGGINGAGIARDAAGRGLRVLLIEQHDLAAGTSSASTKLIHGGLRYLEHGELGLVRESLRERELLLRTKPNLVHPLHFVLAMPRRGKPSPTPHQRLEPCGQHALYLRRVLGLRHEGRQRPRARRPSARALRDR